jgi:hypothetical protein
MDWHGNNRGDKLDVKSGVFTNYRRQQQLQKQYKHEQYLLY